MVDKYTPACRSRRRHRQQQQQQQQQPVHLRIPQRPRRTTTTAPEQRARKRTNPQRRVLHHRKKHLNQKQWTSRVLGTALSLQRNIAQVLLVATAHAKPSSTEALPCFYFCGKVLDWWISVYGDKIRVRGHAPESKVGCSIRMILSLGIQTVHFVFVFCVLQTSSFYL